MLYLNYKNFRLLKQAIKNNLVYSGIIVDGQFCVTIKNK
jgi:hypothetical protein